MNIDQTNYEGWFLDYYEGNLSAVQVAELFLFLQQHPELQMEFDAFQPISLTPPDETVFEDKEKLKRDVINRNNIDYYLVAELENDLTLTDRTKLREFLKLHPDLQNDKDLYWKTILQATAEIFQDKKALKRNIIRPLYQQWSFWAASAAIIIMVLGIIYINRPGDDSQTAQNNPDSIPSSIPDKINIADHSNRNATVTVQDNNTIENKREEKKSVKELPFEVKDHLNNQPYIKNNSLAGTVDPNVKRRGVSKSHLRKHEEIDAGSMNQHETLALVQRKGIMDINYPLIEMSPEKRNTELMAGLITPTMEKPKRPGIMERIRGIENTAREKLNKTTGEEILYSQQQSQNETGEHIPFKSRLIKLLAWSLNKFSGERVQMKTDFDQSGNLAAYEISAGKLKVERGF